MHRAITSMLVLALAGTAALAQGDGHQTHQPSPGSDRQSMGCPMMRGGQGMGMMRGQMGPGMMRGGQMGMMGGMGMHGQMGMMNGRGMMGGRGMGMMGMDCPMRGDASRSGR